MGGAAGGGGPGGRRGRRPAGGSSGTAEPPAAAVAVPSASLDDFAPAHTGGGFVYCATGFEDFEAASAPAAASSSTRPALPAAQPASAPAAKLQVNIRPSPLAGPTAASLRPPPSGAKPAAAPAPAPSDFGLFEAAPAPAAAEWSDFESAPAPASAPAASEWSEFSSAPPASAPSFDPFSAAPAPSTAGRTPQKPSAASVIAAAYDPFSSPPPPLQQPPSGGSGVSRDPFAPSGGGLGLAAAIAATSGTRSVAAATTAASAAADDFGGFTAAAGPGAAAIDNDVERLFSGGLTLGGSATGPAATATAGEVALYCGSMRPWMPPSDVVPSLRRATQRPWQQENGGSLCACSSEACRSYGICNGHGWSCFIGADERWALGRGSNERWADDGCAGMAWSRWHGGIAGGCPRFRPGVASAAARTTPRGPWLAAAELPRDGGHAWSRISAAVPRPRPWWPHDAAAGAGHGPVQWRRGGQRRLSILSGDQCVCPSFGVVPQLHPAKLCLRLPRVFTTPTPPKTSSWY